MKKLLKISVFVVAVVTVLLGALSWKARQFLDEGRMAEVLEESINSRVHIGGVEISLFQIPARVVLRDVRLGVRDGEVGKPYRERQPLQGASVEIAEVRLAVSLAAFFERRVEVRELVVHKPKVTMMLFEEGGNSLDELLRSPEGERIEAAEPEEKASSASGETLNVGQLGFLATLQGVALQKGSINLVVEKTGLLMRVEDLNMELSELEVNPAALEAMNATEWEVSGHLFLDPVRQPQERYAALGFSGPVSVRLFDPMTGDLAVSAQVALALDEESYLSSNIPAVTKAWSALGKLDKIGIEIGPLPEKATFGRSESLALHYESERVTLLKPVSLALDDWELALEKGTWIQTEKETHRASAELVAGTKASKRLREKLEKGFRKLPKEIRGEMVEEVEKGWFREGNLYASIESEGRLSKPSLEVTNELPDLEEVSKKAVRRYAEEKLKGLFR